MNDEINKKHLNYEPEIQYKDDYYSEIEYKDNINNTPDEDINEGKEEVDNLLEDMNELNNIINNFPDNVANGINDVYDQILDFADEELKDKEVSRIPEEEDWDYIDQPKEEEDKNEDKEDDNDFDNMWSTDDFFPTKKEEHTLSEIYEKEYIKNLVDLFSYYNSELNSIISDFWRDYMLSTSNKTISEIRLILNNILFNSSRINDDSKHLLDSAVRQQIIKDMKMDYYSLMFNAEETIVHLKQLKAVQELRMRYAKIEEVNGNTKTNQMNNNILKSSRILYSKKYDIAYENLYRYLNTSNKVLRDSFQTWIAEIKSKQILIERKGIK